MYYSVEVVLSDNGREVVFGLSLGGSCKSLELGETLGVVHALFELVQLGLANSHCAVHLEHALTSIIEGLEAHGLELQVFRVAAKHVEGFGLCLLGVTLVHGRSGSLLLESQNFLSALVKVNVEEDHLLYNKRKQN